MTAESVLAGGAAGGALLVLGAARAAARGRAARTAAGGRAARTAAGARPPRTGSAGRASGRSWRLLATRLLAGTALTVVAVALLGRGPVLLGTALVLLVSGRRWTQERSRRSREAARVAAELPRVADLVATCLEAGAAPADALDAVRAHVAGTVTRRLAPVAAALRMGLDPLDAYPGHDPDDPVRALVRALARAMDRGAPLADTVTAVADEQRRRRRWVAEAAARRAGVHAVGPLVVCYLPAFVLLGVVPMVVGIAVSVLSDLS